MCFIVFWVFSFAIAQNPSDLVLSPNGVLDQVFDRYGKNYQLINLQIPNTNQPVTSTNNRFNLYFENGSGMELSNNSTHLARRQVLLKVLEDVSTFIDLPVSNNKVNIWVRSLNAMTTSPTARLSMGTSFYNVTQTQTTDIADGEVWKSLLSGVSSYTNVVSNPNSFYHGVLAFNFSTFNGATVNWHTAINTATASGRYDLYTAMLKEVMHLLGLTSLIGPDSKSIFPGQYQYYSRYDRSLVTANGTSLLRNSGTVTMYNYSFNAALSPTVLRPGCSLPNHTNPNTADNTTCNQAIYYKNSVFLPVYTPTCFEVGNSLTNLEDQLHPSCVAPHGNNRYFVTSNRLNIAQHKRFPKPEERLILIDLGYKLKTTFGSSTTFGGTTNYGNVTLGNQQVAGVNDGINSDLTYSFICNFGETISINGSSLLSNESHANRFEGLQVTQPGTALISVSSGNHGTPIMIQPLVSGVIALRYVPLDANRISGNISTVWVYVLRNVEDCAPVLACDLVKNGKFESAFAMPNPNILSTPISDACNWEAHNKGMINSTSTSLSTSGDNNFYLHQNAPLPVAPLLASDQYNVPINHRGQQSDAILSHKAYIKYTIFKMSPFESVMGSSVKTRLTSPLLAGQSYQLTFQVSRAEATSHTGTGFRQQAFLSPTEISPNSNHFLTQAQVNQGILLTSANNVTTMTGWDTITFNFVANGGEEFLYLGALRETTQFSGTSFYLNYYYIDNVSLTIIPNASNDNYTFSPSTTTQTSANSILLNDDTQSSPPNYPGITITQVGGVVPVPAAGGISFNATGQVVVAPNTPIGTYTLQYFFTGPCGNSNVVTVTVVVSNIVAFFEVDDYYRGCDFVCQQLSPQTVQIKLFDGPNCWVNNDLPNGHGVLLNSIPATTATATVELAPGETLPPGYILHPNATLTIPASATELTLIFNVVFRSIAAPSVTSEAVEVRVYIIPYFVANGDNLVLTTSGGLHPSQPGQTSSILQNDGKLINCGTSWWGNPPVYGPVVTPTDAVVVVTSNPDPSTFNVTPQGNLQVSGILQPDSQYYLTYKLCHPTIPNFCSPETWIFFNVP